MNMQFLYDPTGFPMVKLRRFDIQLLPVTKVQFETFMAESGEFGDSWYEEILSVSPRASYRNCANENRENVFITGLLPQEIMKFARWMGEGFALPTVAEWRDIYGCLSYEFIKEYEQLISKCPSQQASCLLKRLGEQLGIDSWLKISLMKDGLLEWTMDGNAWVGLGSPRSEFLPNLYNPFGEVVRPIDTNTRSPYFGCRFLRRY